MPSPRPSPPGSKGTGESRTGSTGSETSSSTRTATSYAPLTAPRSWPHYATWPSASSDSSTAPASPSPAPPDPCHDNPNEPSNYSPKPTLPTPCPDNHRSSPRNHIHLDPMISLILSFLRAALNDSARVCSSTLRYVPRTDTVGLEVVQELLRGVLTAPIGAGRPSHPSQPSTALPFTSRLVGGGSPAPPGQVGAAKSV